MSFDSEVKGWHVVLGIAVLFLVVVIWFGSELSYKNQNPSSTVQVQPKSEMPAKLLEYTTVKTQDISYANTPKMVHRIVLNVTGIPSEAEIKATALHIWEFGNKKWSEFTVFMYLPDTNTNGEAFAVAEFRPQGLKELRVQTLALAGTKWETLVTQKEKVIAETASSLRKKIERETGPVSLTTEIKKKIYREFVNDPLWVEDDGTEKLVLKLGDKYMRRYNLSRTELAAICAEGAEKGW